MRSSSFCAAIGSNFKEPTMAKPRQESQKPVDLSHSHAQRWLLAYDIREPRRLSRVCRYLSVEATRLQYSVYLLKGGRHQIEPIIQRVKNLIDEKNDDVRIYPITESTRIWGLGTQFDDQGVTLCDAVMAKLVGYQANMNGVYPDRSTSAGATAENLATPDTNPCEPEIFRRKGSKHEPQKSGD